MSHKPLLDVDLLPELTLRYGIALQFLVKDLKEPIEKMEHINWTERGLGEEYQQIVAEHLSNDNEGQHNDQSESEHNVLVYETLAQRMLGLWLSHIEIQPESIYQEMILNSAAEWENYNWIKYDRSKPSKSS